MFKPSITREYLQPLPFCTSVSKSLKLPVSKHNHIVMSYVIFQYIIYHVISSLYIYVYIYVFFPLKSIKHSWRWRKRIGSIYDVRLAEIEWSHNRGYMESKSLSLSPMTSGVMTLPMKRMDPGQRSEREKEKVRFTLTTADHVLQLFSLSFSLQEVPKCTFPSFGEFKWLSQNTQSLLFHIINHI